VVRTRAVYGLAGLGLIARLVLAALSRGSNDAAFWEEFAWQISHFGIRSLYDHEPWFTHPPLMGGWAFLSLRIAELTWLPFPALLKLPGILGDIGTALLLHRVWQGRGAPKLGVPLPAWAVLVFAWNLDAILISSFHGNTDSLCTMFLFCAFVLQAERRPLGAGLALAATLNVKLLPVLCVPLLLLQQRTWTDGRRFSLGLLAGIVPYLPYLVTSAWSMISRMLGYASNPEPWGVLAFLSYSVDLPLLGAWAAWAAESYHVHGRYLLIAIFLGLGLVQRHWSPWTVLELGALALAAFLVFAPGFGIQYTVYVVPFLCAVHLRTAAVYGLAAGVFAGILYLAYWTGGSPWFSLFTDRYPMPVPLFGIVAWVVLAQFLVRTLERGMRRSPFRGVSGSD
jgi:hypothetical protein